jgi:hypothetical protein
MKVDGKKEEAEIVTLTSFLPRAEIPVRKKG